MLSTFRELAAHPPTSIIKSTDSMLIAGRGDELAVFVSIHPDFPVLNTSAARMRAEAEAFVVTDDSTSRQAAERMAEAKSDLKRIEDAMRKPVTRKIDAAKRTVMDIFDEAKTNLEMTISVYSHEINKRAAELRRQADDERRRLEETRRKQREQEERLAAQARQRAEQQRLEAEEARRAAEKEKDAERRRELEAEARRKENLAEGNRQRANEREQTAETLSHDVVVEEREVDLGGAGHFRKTNKARVLDFQKFVKLVASGEIPNGFGMLELNQSKVNDRARDLGRVFNIDGVVEVYEDAGVTSRAAR